MSIKDIVNRGLVNLDNCESEPIHIPGSIQPHGFLLALEPVTDRIVYCSANLADFAGLHPEQVLGKTPERVFPGASLAPLLEALKGKSRESEYPVIVTINGCNYECQFHAHLGPTILEFEPAQTEPMNPDQVFIQTRQFIRNIEGAGSLRALCQMVASDIRQISGYDRVMIYRFDEQYNGEVYAESKRDGIEPFLGLHYPHTDIPVQARQLYIRNQLRLITDVTYTPSPIFTLADGEVRQLDLSFAMLRSVSPIHLQYLQNMGVGATLTISLLHEGKLWGLIACHHYEPKYVNYQVRMLAKLQGHFLTSQIKVRETGEEYAIAKELDVTLNQLLEKNIVENRGSLEQLVCRPELLDLCHATGVALVFDGKILASGTRPDDHQIALLSQSLAKDCQGKFLQTDHLAALYPGWESEVTAAGLLYHPIGKDGEAILWFRKENRLEVHWGGDPEKAILKDETGLHPRKSFETWKETVKGRSLPWTKPELQAAGHFAHALQRQVHLLMVAEEESKYRALSYQLKEANAELENINWISAHDLKEPLRKIQVFASRILDHSEADPNRIYNSVVRMKDAAQRMQMLINDILSYSRLAKISDAFETFPLDQSVQQAMEELEEVIHEKRATLNTDKLPEVRGIPFLLTQVFVNLLSNAIKFSRKDIRPEIRIRFNEKKVNAPFPVEQPDKKYHLIEVIDNGIGIPEDQEENIFQVFTRLNGRDAFTGSGVGLAICKKILENHGAFITAHGGNREGSVFRIYFPVNG
ncbi:ATP-binding protein [Flavihumibacter petaseus]|uniref:histidine kinase n=1 Tax=Flavihumibacter petaseus NBRC 106054 TaxID=1220578 RepID=A0A0E9N6X4_9BACT|nr:ATP-binding protein [Flavihumibacter petaseus]GAO45553.1 putative two-component histidine kinase [Flavihumibacter petaseus NBRC 106054]